MTLSFRRALLLLILALVLLLGLLSWTMKLVTIPSSNPPKPAHTIAWGCPPPPYHCWG
ncbi:MAG TPA: hypothetical protein VEL31_04325 [Ktedonobacteraceae bacterium]|nr:hypothetical protein [Ktedonobacteraceae bacterium]